MKKIVRNFLFVLFFCLMQGVVVNAKEVKSLIGEVKSESLFRRLIVSFVERLAIKEYHAFLPTKTSRGLPIVAFSLAFFPLIFKILSLKKNVFELNIKYNKKKKKYDDIVALGNEKENLKQDVLREIYQEEKRVFQQKLESDFKKKESAFKDEIKDFKKLTDALLKQSIHALQQNESVTCETVIEKKHHKMQEKIDVANKETAEKNIQQKRFVHVDDINNQLADDEDIALYKYTYLEESPQGDYVFSFSTKNSSEYKVYKNYLFVLDHPTQDAIAGKSNENEDNFVYRKFRHHAKSCIEKIKPKNGQLFKLIYKTILESENAVSMNDIKNYLSGEKKYFDFVGFFGHTITFDIITSVVHSLDEQKDAILCLAGINHESKKLIKKKKIVKNFKVCLNIRKDDKTKLLKNQVNITLKPFFPEHDDDTISTMSFKHPILFCGKKVHSQEKEFFQYHNYCYIYTKKNGHFCYNVDLSKNRHHIAKSIADNIKCFSEDPIQFVDAKWYKTLLANTLIIQNLHGYRKEKFDNEHAQYKSAIPENKQLMEVDHQVKALIVHQK